MQKKKVMRWNTLGCAFAAPWSVTAAQAEVVDFVNPGPGQPGRYE